MPVARCQVVLQPLSALPADQVVNTFSVDLGSSFTLADLQAIEEAVWDFYVEPVGALAPLSTYLAKSVADNGHQCRVFTYDEVTGDRLAYNGAPPEWVGPTDFVGRTDETWGLPQEVALKCTFRNTTELLVPLARRTGGVKVGPLEWNQGVEGANGVAVPAAVFVTRLADVGDRLKDDLAALGFPLVVWSRPFPGRGEVVRPGKPTLPALPARPGALYPVDTVFVDDEWDTVRKRGRRAGARTVRT